MEPKIYRAVAQPVAMYGDGCYLANNETGRVLDVAKEKMLRQTVWRKPLDRVRNDSVRQNFGVALILRSCAKLDSDGTVTSFAQKVSLRRWLTTVPRYVQEKGLKSAESSAELV